MMTNRGLARLGRTAEELNDLHLLDVRARGYRRLQSGPSRLCLGTKGILHLEAVDRRRVYTPGGGTEVSWFAATMRSLQVDVKVH